MTHPCEHCGMPTRPPKHRWLPPRKSCSPACATALRRRRLTETHAARIAAGKAPEAPFQWPESEYDPFVYSQF